MGPLKLMGLGLAMMLGSWTVIYLIVLGVIGNSFLLSLAAYALSLAGFGIGMFGVVHYVRGRRTP